ncbi:MAG: 3-keto-L-gulonate-6-phosphate decarboxylase [Ruminococcaceae bacterium]|nr:3-keto-L-gulonate-6-phosphate decarboxylase [Oscillospiraceae bacterium]
MKAPYLQIALDNTSLEEACNTLKGGLGEEVDIIECGTMLILMEGMKAVRCLRALYPDKIMVADAQLSVAHFGPKILAGGTQFVTMFSPARNEVKAEIQAYAKEHGQAVQIELYGDYGDSWTFDDLREWKELGITQIIYGRPSSASGPWTSQDVDFVRQLCDMGFEVTATGGVTYDDLDILAGLPLYAVICGRSIRNAPNPAAEARRIRNRIHELWK